MTLFRFVFISFIYLNLFGCGYQETEIRDMSVPEKNTSMPSIEKQIEESIIPFPSSTIEKKNPPKYLITNARILTGLNKVFESGFLKLKNGKIDRIGHMFELKTVSDIDEIIDVKGSTVTPGLIDVHSHLGLRGSPATKSNRDINEATSPNRADVSAKDGFWPQDSKLWLALAGGVTTIQVLPGSSNIIGGKSFIAKLRPKVTANEMQFKEGKVGLKAHCGSAKSSASGWPSTRMGVAAFFRKIFNDAKMYGMQLENFKSNKLDNSLSNLPFDFKKNPKLETILKVLKGEMPLHVHCYREDDISNLIDISNEFGFKIGTIHHGTSAYKIRDRISELGISVATWVDWENPGLEGYDLIPHSVAMLHEAGVSTIIHSDFVSDVQRLNQEAAKALVNGWKLGIKIDEKDAIKWISTNPAKSLGVEKYVGTLEVGKMADIVIWNQSPFSSLSHAQKVLIDGYVVFDRKAKLYPKSDFETGNRQVEIESIDEVQKKYRTEKVAFKDFSYLYDSNYQLPSKNFLIKNVRIDLGTRVESQLGYISVSNGLISEVGLGHAPSIYKGPIVDGDGKILTPGLIEPYSTLGVVEAHSAEQSVDNSPKNSRQMFSPGFLVSDGFNPLSPRIPDNRSLGITSALVPAIGGILAGIGYWIDLDPNLYDQFKYNLKNSGLYGSVSGRMVQHSGGARGLLWQKVRAFFKASIDGTPSSNIDFTDEQKIQFSEFLNLPDSERLPIVLEAQRASDIKNIIDLKQALKKNNLNIQFVIKGGHESWFLADQLAIEKIPVMLTPSDLTFSRFENIQARYDLPKILDSKGVKIIISAGHFTKRLPQEVGIAISYGLSRNTALRSVTQNIADIFDRGDEIGSIKVGKKANLVLWSGPYYEPTTVPLGIWIEGKSMSLNTRSNALANKYR